MGLFAPFVGYTIAKGSVNTAPDKLSPKNASNLNAVRDALKAIAAREEIRPNVEYFIGTGDMVLNFNGEPVIFEVAPMRWPKLELLFAVRNHPMCLIIPSFSNVFGDTNNEMTQLLAARSKAIEIQILTVQNDRAPLTTQAISNSPEPFSYLCQNSDEVQTKLNGWLTGNKRKMANAIA